MRRSSSSHSHRDEKSGSSRHKGYDTVPRSRSEEEKLRRRREWRIQQEREREHEKLKQKMILEFELRRAKEKGLPLPRGRSDRSSSSSRRSRSKERRPRTPPSKSYKPTIMSQKLESSNGTTQQLFKGPQGTQICVSELRKIKVDIHRSIPVALSVQSDLQRDILNPEDVIVKRREGKILFFLILLSIFLSYSRRYTMRKRSINVEDVSQNYENEDKMCVGIPADSVGSTPWEMKIQYERCPTKLQKWRVK